MKIKLFTIGVYGFSEETFFQALQTAGIDVFCDIRWRRGVRGAAYAFANSQRLQKRLAELDIHYLYRRDLAPTPAIRQRQKEADKADKIAKRQRTGLGEPFIAAYQSEILAHFDPQSLLDDLPANARKVVLCCVEREPAACHRSLVAAKLAEAWRSPVVNIQPFRVTRAHLKNACDQRNGDLLDKLLEIDNKLIDDAAFYTDTWGEWWGLLLECVYSSWVDGVRILLKHGADRRQGNWGDCLPITPEEAAAGKPEILQLLTSRERPAYTRQSDPPLPITESEDDRQINRQGQIRDETGLVFQTEAFE